MTQSVARLVSAVNVAQPYLYAIFTPVFIESKVCKIVEVYGVSLKISKITRPAVSLLGSVYFNVKDGTLDVVRAIIAHDNATIIIRCANKAGCVCEALDGYGVLCYPKYILEEIPAESSLLNEIAEDEEFDEFEDYEGLDESDDEEDFDLTFN